MNYIIASDYMPSDGSTDVTDALQQLIDQNPNRTIFFPDGTYLLGKPIMTPAHPQRSVDLQLSNFACIKAAENWNSDEAMIRLGGKDAANDIYTPGSNYGLCGGIIDGSGVAKAVSIDGGRETYVRNVNIKNAVIGLHIKRGANNGSSDADIMGVNVTGNGAPDSVGVLIDGYDNTLTNMRIADVFTGVEIRGGGNMLRNIHPLYIIHDETYGRYEESVGFRILHPMNWFDYCYSDQFAVGFDTIGGGILKNCFCWWYSDRERCHVALRSKHPFSGGIDSLVIGGAHHPECPNRFMDVENIGAAAAVEKVYLIAADGKTERIR
ncbi:MAG: hypothetical protein IJW97_00825 [Clostridia bacterium]|nr:hypothetical protein [Clostridia bacterium]